MSRKANEPEVDVNEQEPEVAKENPTRAKRAKRIPIGTRDVLVADQRPGYVRRIVNTEKQGRVQMFLDAGYTIVDKKKDTYSEVGRASATGSADERDVGSGKAVVMEQKQEWYDEDQKAKQDRVDEQEQSMAQSAKDQGLVGSVKKVVKRTG